VWIADVCLETESCLQFFSELEAMPPMPVWFAPSLQTEPGALSSSG
jgi:hypothetical protein